MNINHIFITIFLVVTAFLIAFIFIGPIYILDAIAIYLYMLIFYLISRKYALTRYLIVLGFLPFLISLCAVAFGLYGFTFFGIGFDKLLHMVNCFAGTLLFYHWIRLNRNERGYILIAFCMLLVLGAGAFSELSEFVGERYFGVYGAGMFTQDDLLSSEVANDLTRFDVWWDMMFNLFGTILGAIFIFAENIFFPDRSVISN